jgi:hypothetical protein
LTRAYRHAAAKAARRRAALARFHAREAVRAKGPKNNPQVIHLSTAIHKTKKRTL